MKWKYIEVKRKISRTSKRLLITTRLTTRCGTKSNGQAMKKLHGN